MLYLCSVLLTLILYLWIKQNFLELHEKQKSNGLTEKQYCQGHSIAYSSFQYW